MSLTLRRGARRVSALTGIAALTVITLTGCIKVDANVAINSDATASGTFAFELQKDAASFLGISDLASFEQQIAEGALTEGDELNSFQECVTGESDTGYTYTCTFANTAFADPDGLWSIAKEGSTIVFTMASEGAGDEGADAASMLGEAGMGSIDVTVEFPGTITSVQGDLVEKTSDTTARVSASMTDTIDITIRSEDGAAQGGIAGIIVVAIAAGVVVLLIVAVILLIMRRRAGTRTPELPPAPESGEMPGTPGTGATDTGPDAPSSTDDRP